MPFPRLKANYSAMSFCRRIIYTFFRNINVGWQNKAVYHIIQPPVLVYFIGITQLIKLNSNYNDEKYSLATGIKTIDSIYPSISSNDIYLHQRHRINTSRYLLCRRLQLINQTRTIWLFWFVIVSSR